MWPVRIIRGQGSDPNNASIVLRVQTHGVVLLFTGDVEPAAQDAMLRRDPGSLRADILKVPNHGSTYQNAGYRTVLQLGQIAESEVRVRALGC